MELFKGEYSSMIMMLTKDIFGNQIKYCMCQDYHPTNKQTCLDKYVMPLLEEIFDILKQVKVFNTLNLWFNYHQLSLKENDKVKMTNYVMVMVIINLDDPNVWLQACEQCVTLFQCVYAHGHGKFDNCPTLDTLWYAMIYEGGY